MKLHDLAIRENVEEKYHTSRVFYGEKLKSKSGVW